MSRESFLKKAAVPGRSASHTRSRKQEKNVAKRSKGRLIPASGSGVTKGDVRVKGFARIECKTTKNRSFSVTLEMIDKIELAALASGEVPMIVVEFNDGYGRKIKEVAVIPTFMLDRFL